MKRFSIILTTFFVLFLYSCSDPKEDYIDRFGNFINEVELAQDQYDDDEWVLIEADFNEFSQIEFIQFKDVLTKSELNQIRSYRERFKIIQIKRDPSGSLLEILGF
jgi:hypothetical protein